MARVKHDMQIVPVDQDHSLFAVENFVPDDLAREISSTPWMNLEWHQQPLQETWKRRRINDSEITWLDHWNLVLDSQWESLSQAIGRTIIPWARTAWWVDEPGFTCSIHCDGELPAALQLFWVGQDVNLGTVFYHGPNGGKIRYRFSMTQNTGYLMVNLPDESGYRKPQWHGMTTPVAPGTFRVTSYTWINFVG